MPILPSANHQTLTGALKDMFAFARRSEGPGKSLGPLKELLVDGEVTLSAYSFLGFILSYGLTHFVEHDLDLIHPR